MKSKVARRLFLLFLLASLLPMGAIAVYASARVSGMLVELSQHRLKQDAKALGMSVVQELNLARPGAEARGRARPPGGRPARGDSRRLSQPVLAPGRDRAHTAAGASPRPRPRHARSRSRAAAAPAAARRERLRVRAVGSAEHMAQRPRGGALLHSGRRRSARALFHPEYRPRSRGNAAKPGARPEHRNLRLAHRRRRICGRLLARASLPRTRSPGSSSWSPNPRNRSARTAKARRSP